MNNTDYLSEPDIWTPRNDEVGTIKFVDDCVTVQSVEQDDESNTYEAELTSLEADYISERLRSCTTLDLFSDASRIQRTQQVSVNWLLYINNLI